MEAGNLERSYRRAPRGAGDDKNASAAAGICHLCKAGLEGFDWEDPIPGCKNPVLLPYMLENRNFHGFF